MADPWSLQKPFTEMILTGDEQLAFLQAIADNPTPQLVPMLSGLLDPGQPRLHPRVTLMTSDRRGWT